MEWAFPPRRGYYVHIINRSSHGISVYVRHVCPYCPDIIQATALLPVKAEPALNQL